MWCIQTIEFEQYVHVCSLFESVTSVVFIISYKTISIDSRIAIQLTTMSSTLTWSYPATISACGAHMNPCTRVCRPALILERTRRCPNETISSPPGGYGALRVMILYWGHQNLIVQSSAHCPSIVGLSLSAGRLGHRRLK